MLLAWWSMSFLVCLRLRNLFTRSPHSFGGFIGIWCQRRCASLTYCSPPQPGLYTERRGLTRKQELSLAFPFLVCCGDLIDGIASCGCAVLKFVGLAGGLPQLRCIATHGESWMIRKQPLPEHVVAVVKWSGQCGGVDFRIQQVSAITFRDTAGPHWRPVPLRYLFCCVCACASLSRNVHMSELAFQLR